MLKLAWAQAARAGSVWTGRTSSTIVTNNKSRTVADQLLPPRTRRRAVSIAQSYWPVASAEKWSRLARIGVQLSAAFLVLFVFLQWIGERNHDPYHCEALVKHGQWPPFERPPDEFTYVYESLKRLEDEGREPPPARAFDKWEPIGCRMHEYSRDDMMGCLGGQRLLFVGDSSIRQLFFSALRRLDHETADWLLYSIFSEGDTQQDLNIEAESVQLDFIWDPWLNSTALKAELEGDLTSRMPQLNSRYSLLNGTEEVVELEEQRPLIPAAMIVMGAPGLWAARNGGEDYFNLFQEAIDYVEPYLNQWVHPSPPFTASTDEEREDNTKQSNYIFLSPVPVPKYDMLPDVRTAAIPLEHVQEMNDYLDSLPESVQSHILTAYNDMTLNVPEAYADTGLHVKDGVAERWIDIPLNVRCNGWLTQPRAPGDGAASRASQRTCCAAYPPMMGGQAMFALGLCALILINALAQSNGLRLPYSTSLKYTSFLSVAVLYSYVADRTHLFAKTEKHDDQRALVCMLCAAGLLFLASFKRVDRKRKGSENGHRQPWLPQWLSENDVLPRHITDEWKGIMIVANLLVSYIDTSYSTAVFKWKRLFVSAYLFLSAYGHASYFLHTDDFSMMRVTTILFRLNILPCFVSLMLDGSEYGFNNSTLHLNYFPRLVSFWFLVIYVTLCVGHSRNESHPLQLMGRIVASAALVFIVLVWSDVYDMLEVASQISQIFCHTEWRADAMRRLITLDLLPPFLGMLVAVVAHRIALVNYKMDLLYPFPCPESPAHARQKEQQRRVEQFHEFNETNNVTRLDGALAAVWYPEEFASQAQAVLVCLSLLAGTAFLYEAHYADDNDRGRYDVYYHPAVSCTAILAMVVLRSCHFRLRSVYLAWPAALGRFALELSVLQNHIFLASNGTGRLRTGFWPQPSSDAEDSFGKFLATVGWKLETVMLVTILVWISHKAYAATRKIAASLFGYEGASSPSSVYHT